jgi:hypothetical protein
MKKVLALPLFLCALAISVQAQNTLKKVLELKMPRTADDDMPGTRGASVAWHPVQKKYYAVFAGNMDYPLAVFDAKGTLLSDAALSAMIDTRGLWYDPVSKAVTGNGYDEAGWFSYKLNAKGIPTEMMTVIDDMNQPDPQSVGTYNSGAKQVLFLHNSQVHMYDEDGEPIDSVQIHWSRKKTDGPGDEEDIEIPSEDHNNSTVIFTGIKGQEAGFLNVTNKAVELYDLKTGYMTKTLSLPQNATVETMFNFAYANGIYWLFDIAGRKWVGYK